MKDLDKPGLFQIFEITKEHVKVSSANKLEEKFSWYFRSQSEWASY